MPAQSVAQRRLMAIAEHHPEKVRAKNRGVLKMSRKQLHDYAATSEGTLPSKVKKSAKGSGPFSLGQLGRGFKVPRAPQLGGLRQRSPQIKVPGFKGGIAQNPRLDTPGLTGRLRPRAALSNPMAQAGGGMGMLSRSLRGSGSFKGHELQAGYRHVGKC